MLRHSSAVWLDIANHYAISNLRHIGILFFIKAHPRSCLTLLCCTDIANYTTPLIYSGIAFLGVHLCGVAAIEKMHAIGDVVMFWDLFRAFFSAAILKKWIYVIKYM